MVSGGNRSWLGCVPPTHREQSTPPHPVALRTPSFPASSLSSGKFGEVCTCTEKATGLKLAAKVIKKQTPKDKVVGVWLCGRGRGSLEWVPLNALHPHICTRGLVYEA